MSVEFKLNYAGIGELLKSPELAAALAEHAKVIEEQAKQIAPVETGRYRDSIESGLFAEKDRTSAYVAATVPYAINVEVHDRVLGHALGAAESEAL